MKHLTILIPDGQSNLSTVACIAGACEMFTEANNYWRKTGRNSLFTIELAGVSETSEIHNGFVTLKPSTAISQIERTDLVIIPSSLIRSYENAAKSNRLLIGWVTKQYKAGAGI